MTNATMDDGTELCLMDSQLAIGLDPNKVPGLDGCIISWRHNNGVSVLRLTAFTGNDDNDGVAITLTRDTVTGELTLDSPFVESLVMENAVAW